ncbi:long-chain fatty acid--CoA ligase [Cryobacterium frigoriphilum]|uniref:Long-chain fatty acid--CoA ligase n=1 Tax=Cryobacterium frigoriphilum TaxID=1259150 RepID=A0A4R8ZUH9_9MICO|nr:class I adenylate-forming enzyme family protein [Cryobacterium frigoriphilum]TFD45975.1 long-chain fatty acid--CoA ligase [Cryobacterium frigoriphilum]
MAPTFDTASQQTIWALARHWADHRSGEHVIVDLPNPAEADGLRETTWERLVTDTAELRRRLAAIGVTDQRTALLSLPNSPLNVALWLAILANDAIVQAIDVESGVLVFERAIAATNPSVVFACTANAAQARAAIARTGSTARLIVPTDLGLVGHYGSIDGLARLGAEPATGPSTSVAAVLPTSGTSGLPKWVQLTQANIVMAAERLARSSGYLATDRHYLCSPFFHTNAQLYLCAPPFVTGGSIAIVPRFSASGYFSAARTTGATVSSMVAPPLRMALHKAIASGESDSGGLRLIQYGMTLSAADWDEWDDRFASIEMRQIYGQTESVTGVLGGSAWDTDDRVTIGRPFLGVPGVRLVGDDGDDVADGEPGELWVQGKPGSTLMLGYLDAPEATAETLVDGEWLRTGDIMVRQSDGRFQFRGRRMHIIRRGGENLSTYALELDLQACPLVTDVAITAKEDERLDALVVAHVIPDTGYTEPGFIEWCRTTLGKRAVPDEIRLRTSFPRTGSGRVIARDLE